MLIDKVSVIGLGYIGLPTAAMFASHGVKVVGVDISETVVNTVNAGEIHIVEPGLAELVKNAVSHGNLRATSEMEAADAFLIAVPTPFADVGQTLIKQPDLSYVMNACQKVAEVLKPGDLIILESTSPVGATEAIAKYIAELRPDLNIPGETTLSQNVFIAHCPERVLPGNVLNELIDNDRIIGGVTHACSERAQNLYNVFVKGKCHITDARTAEMAKLTENASRDVQIAFANELSLICDNLKIDVWELIALANRHPRVNILQPGPGVGGHCIAVDPWFIVASDEKNSVLMQTARKVNESKPHWVISKINEIIGGKTNVNVCCFGLAFKPNIDDLRESPSLEIARHLSANKNINLYCVEPNIQFETVQDMRVISMSEATQIADVAVLLVKHEEFESIEFPKQVKVIDVCGLM